MISSFQTTAAGEYLLVVNHQSQTSCMAALPWRCAHLQTARGTTGG